MEENTMVHQSISLSRFTCTLTTWCQPEICQKNESLHLAKLKQIKLLWKILNTDQDEVQLEASLGNFPANNGPPGAYCDDFLWVCKIFWELNWRKNKVHEPHLSWVVEERDWVRHEEAELLQGIFSYCLKVCCPDFSCWGIVTWGL